MTDTPLDEAEELLRALSARLTDPAEGECLLCYVHRMLEHGCHGLRWALRYRDLRAPRATALERRLQEKGASCDCEVFLNAYQLQEEHLVLGALLDVGGFPVGEVLEYPHPMPPCRGVRAGSTRPCALWRRQHLCRW